MKRYGSLARRYGHAKKYKATKKFTGVKIDRDDKMIYYVKPNGEVWAVKRKNA